MLGSTSRVKVLVVGVAVVVGLAGCGPKHAGSSAGMPAATADYAGLRFVPADVSYALVSRRTEDAVLVMRDLADSFGLLAGEDAAHIGSELAGELGFDPLTAAGIAEQGVDLTRGFALWSRGIGPNLALPLADPARFVAMIEGYRSQGVVVQVQRVDGVEIYTWMPDSDVALHWAIVDDWLIAHLQFDKEHEADNAWFAAAMAARGAFGAEADFAAARDEGSKRVGTPGVVGVVRVPALFATALGTSWRGCGDTFGRVGRVLVSAATEGKDARGAIVAELPGGVDGIRAMQLLRPVGWEAARAQAPLQVEAALDLRAVAPLWAACLEVPDLADEPARWGMYGGRAFAYELDPGDLKGRGAAAVFGEPRAFVEIAEQIPAPDFLRKSRKVAGIAVSEINVPMMPHLSYAIIDTTAVATVDLSIDPLLGPLAAPGDELARLEVHPQKWSEDTWSQLVGMFITRPVLRERAVRGLRRWSLGSIVARLEARAVVIDLHGTH